MWKRKYTRGMWRRKNDKNEKIKEEVEQEKKNARIRWEESLAIRTPWQRNKFWAFNTLSFLSLRNLNLVQSIIKTFLISQDCLAQQILNQFTLACKEKSDKKKIKGPSRVENLQG